MTNKSKLCARLEEFFYGYNIGTFLFSVMSWVAIRVFMMACFIPGYMMLSQAWPAPISLNNNTISLTITQYHHQQHNIINNTESCF